MIRFLRLFDAFANLERKVTAAEAETASLRDRLAVAENDSQHWSGEYVRVQNENSMLLKSMVNEVTQRSTGYVRFPEAHALPPNLAGPQPGPTSGGRTISRASATVAGAHQAFLDQIPTLGGSN